MARTAVSNSSPLIVLGAIGKLDLLSEAFDEIIVPAEVAREVGGIPDFVRVREVSDTRLIDVLLNEMDLGEAAAILLALECGPSTVVLDDFRARPAAQRLGLCMVGSLGLVLSAKREGRISEVRPIMAKLLDAGLYLSPDLVERVLREANESGGISFPPKNL